MSPKFIYRTYYFFIDNKIYQVEIKDDIENKVQKSDGYFKLISTVISIEPLPNNDDLMCFIRILNKAFLARKGTGIYSNWIKKFDLTLIYKNFEIKNV